MHLERLAERHLPLLASFTCVERDEDLQHLNADKRRRVRNHSKDMDRFILHEAYNDQVLGLSTTFVLLDDAGSRVLGYISLCSDAIGLEVQERTDSGIVYSSAPALKIARLAVDVTAAHHGLGQFLVQFAAYQAQIIREHAGIFFITLDCYAHRLSYYTSMGFVQNSIQPITRQYDSPISMRISLDTYLEKVGSTDTSF